MKRNLFLFCITALTLSSCKKAGDSSSNCVGIQNATITFTSPVTIGQTIKLSVPEVGGYRIYKWTGPNNYNNQYPSDSITYAELKNEGWYYLDLYSLDGDCQKIDSVFVDVKLQQGTPSCNIPANTVSYNNLGGDSYSYAHKGIEPNFSLKALDCSGAGNMTVYFHPYWRTAEPEDGIYTTINTPLFDQTDYNYNKVFITTTKSSIYWASHENQTVYISHVNGKLQVRFCNLSMGGNNGTSYTTIASGNLQEL